MAPGKFTILGVEKVSRTVAASDMAAHAGKKIRLKGCPVTRKEILTREGGRNGVFAFEDKNRNLRGGLFPETIQTILSGPGHESCISTAWPGGKRI